MTKHEAARLAKNSMRIIRIRLAEDPTRNITDVIEEYLKEQFILWSRPTTPEDV